MSRTRRRKHWGWGYEDEQPSGEQLLAQAEAVAAHLGFGELQPQAPVPLEALKMRPPRVQPPARLAEICAQDDHARASHALGKSYRDVVAGFRGEFRNPPDLVIAPNDEDDVVAALQWCEAANVAAIPYGGGTSVVGGVEPRVPDTFDGTASIDIGRLDKVLEVDPVSRAARIQAGTLGPSLEAQLSQHGFTLRHFPQSFELSTLGGWIATRAGGHFATLFTHIDDLVESVRAVTPAGAWESRRLPGSGAGPSPDRMLIGSEGALGVITEAWVRVQAPPEHRSKAAVAFSSFAVGAQCARALSQSGLHPANCRLVDPAEAALTGSGDGGSALLLLAFESSDHEVDVAMQRALEICAKHGGTWERVHRQGPGDRARADSDGVVSTWRQAFLAAPYLRDTLVAMGVISETFETAITWERFPSLHERVIDAARRATTEATGVGCGDRRGEAKVTCRFTHLYPDGPAAYFTVLAPGRRGEEVEQWDAIKRAVSDAIIDEGGTITHHHAVGRDHMPWYERQRPEPFAAALAGAKAAVDPAGVMNPGVLVTRVTSR